MKRLFYFFAVVGMFAIACEGGNGVEEENDANLSIPKIELSQQNVEVDFECGTYAVSVTSPYSWDAVSKNTWIVVETEIGIAGTKELSFKVERNEVEKAREGIIVLSNSTFNLAAELYVTQKAFDCSYVIAYTSSDEKIVTPKNTGVFGANIVSNTYNGEQGVILFDAPVTSIGNGAFEDCGSLISITIPDSVTSIGERAFFYCSSLKSVIIPDSVTSIGWGAFEDCSRLKSVTIGNSVTEIGYFAFYNCESLTSVIIGDSVSSINSYAFGYCSRLKSLTISNSVTSIGEKAFYVCSGLTSVYCQPETPPEGGEWMFNSNASGRKIYVPRISVSAYKARTYWKDYASDIVGYDF